MPAKDPKEKPVNKVVVELPEKTTLDTGDSLKIGEPSSLTIESEKSDAISSEAKKEDQLEKEVETPLQSIKSLQDMAKEPIEQGLETESKLPSVKIDSGVLESSDVKIEGVEEIPRRGKKKVYVVGVIITALILGAVGGVFFFRVRESKLNLDKNLFSNYFGKQAKDNEVQPETSTEKTDNQEDKPGGLLVKEAEGVERSEISLEILNGTDTAGLAGKTAETFEELGYQIDKIGNADEDAAENQIYVNPDMEGKLRVLLGDVKEELGISSVSGEFTDSDASARIILGE